MWFQLFSQVKIQSCIKLQVSSTAKMSGVLPTLCLLGCSPLPELIQVPVPCIWSMKKRMMLIANLLCGTKHICNCSLYLAFLGMISEHRANGRDNQGQIFQKRTMGWPSHWQCCRLQYVSSSITGPGRRTLLGGIFLTLEAECISQALEKKGFSVSRTQCSFIPQAWHVSGGPEEEVKNVPSIYT